MGDLDKFICGDADVVVFASIFATSNDNIAAEEVVGGASVGARRCQGFGRRELVRPSLRHAGGISGRLPRSGLKAKEDLQIIRSSRGADPCYTHLKGRNRRNLCDGPERG